MAFSTPLFLFFFFPLLLALFAFVAPRAQNRFLLFCSLFFYIWSEGRNSWILLLAIAITYGSARAMAATSRPRRRSLFLALGIGANLFMLAACKYAVFFIRNLNSLLSHLGAKPLALPSLPLPLGISFFTFLAISFLIDSHRQAARPRLGTTALYLSFFPTILAGPINPYRELKPQLEEPGARSWRIREGVQRFIVGLAKKALVADILARTVNAIFAIPGPDLTPGVAWLGIAAFTLQIYFDFSGYTDMAIGLGLIFGFRFMENFRYPYAATSILDFWTRWHKSLTRWLRDYLFLPLAYGVLKLTRRERWLGIKLESWAYGVGMFLTMLLCGLWHGAAWTFIAWGVYHGLFLLLERFVWGRRLKKAWRPLRHLYAMLLVAVGWVFFRSANMDQAFSFLKAMAGLNRGNGQLYYPQLYLGGETALVLLAAVIASVPLLPAAWSALGKSLGRRKQAWRSALSRLQEAIVFLCLLVLLLLSYLYLANATYQPFIYFRF